MLHNKRSLSNEKPTHHKEDPAQPKINNTSFKSLESFKEYLLITKRKNSNFTMEKTDSITVTKVIKINVNNHETYQHCVPPEIMK